MDDLVEPRRSAGSLPGQRCTATPAHVLARAKEPDLWTPCQFATSLDSPEHIAIAEQSGYHRAWLHDTPAQRPDVWAMLAQAAERTHRIGLAPGVLVPTLRHPMVNASGAATLAALAPRRAALAFGTAFNGTRALRAPPATWSYLSTYVRTVRELLRGDTVEWDGALMCMLHPGTNAPQRPIEIPVLI